MKELKDPIREAEAEFKRTINRSELRGVTQCQTHKWRKLNDSELACELCPTVIRVAEGTADSYVG